MLAARTSRSSSYLFTSEKFVKIWGKNRHRSNSNSTEELPLHFQAEWKSQPRRETPNIRTPQTWSELTQLAWHYIAFSGWGKSFLSCPINLCGKPSLEVTRSKMSNSQLYEAELPAKICLLRDRWQIQPVLRNYSCMPQLSQIYVCDH